MTSNSICKLYETHEGKVSDKWSHYIHVYDDIFGVIRDSVESLLEIGVQNGGSLEIWAKYFSGATCIVGCDVNEKCGNLIFDDPRISVVVGDINDENSRIAIKKQSERFDVIIDDGSHRSGDVIKSFARYFSMLRDGGVYIVEDLHCSYWPDFEGGLFLRSSAISFFKILIDIVNRNDWGGDESMLCLLDNFAKIHGVDFRVSNLKEIRSIEFHDSMCVIRRAPESTNILGRRIIAGKHAPVVPDLLQVNGENLRQIQLISQGDFNTHRLREERDFFERLGFYEGDISKVSKADGVDSNADTSDRENGGESFAVEQMRSDGDFFQIFFNFGAGYFENLSETRRIKGDGEVEVFEFFIPPGRELESLRFDPSNESVVVQVEAITITSGAGDAKFTEKILDNADFRAGTTYFFSKSDPQLTIPTIPSELSACGVSVRVALRYLNFGWGARVAAVDATFKGYVEQLSRLRREIVGRQRP
ncbi:class I SAM-dependent methyltransferase [Burkholderia contaminans]|uniref:class I SAM-dependent methyltransferase n=1 Tax=Burkholderia contaminans TaxID=488447 RepID=UPI003D66E0D1